ncbi:hypothetical protein C7445_11082 [Alicyclobacillus sacchari]|uniref:Uncharacterized protein n=1 Tax=Alicyclobacillus sacchari TaxID=392010 RepID=A0A4R8LLW4_9BACL|nr:hypothetical protein [Alicyclobacillus sacchari]TDY44037.1 hypothetical protein C7445_11082 [Alicyclobacillus sacchari]GMA58302.1 hypothetical protein GCM10025858_28050 [Alicyclobacillus sacchari]
MADEDRKSQVGAKQGDEAKLAPGLDGVEGLNRDATRSEIANGEATRVVKLEYDEYDPSES